MGMSWVAHRSCCCGCLCRQSLSPHPGGAAARPGLVLPGDLWLLLRGLRSDLEYQNHFFPSLTAILLGESQPMSIGILVHGSKRIELEPTPKLSLYREGVTPWHQNRTVCQCPFLSLGTGWVRHAAFRAVGQKCSKLGFFNVIHLAF